MDNEKTDYCYYNSSLSK